MKNLPASFCRPVMKYMMMLDTLHATEQQQSGTRHKQVSQARASRARKGVHTTYTHMAMRAMPGRDVTKFART
jgi:hypothetical protein